MSHANKKEKKKNQRGNKLLYCLIETHRIAVVRRIKNDKDQKNRKGKALSQKIHITALHFFVYMYFCMNLKQPTNITKEDTFLSTLQQLLHYRVLTEYKCIQNMRGVKCHNSVTYYIASSWLSLKKRERKCNLFLLTNKLHRNVSTYLWIFIL